MKLNLGCECDLRKDYVNLDKKDFDLNIFPYPFEDNSIEEIVMVNVLEHLDEPYLVVKECHRILKKGGVLVVEVPSFHPSLKHKKWVHGFNYMDAVCGDSSKYQCDFWFSKKVKGVCNFKMLLWQIKIRLLNLIFNEWHFELTKR